MNLQSMPACDEKHQRYAETVESDDEPEESVKTKQLIVNAEKHDTRFTTQGFESRSCVWTDTLEGSSRHHQCRS